MRQHRAPGSIPRCQCLPVSTLTECTLFTQDDKYFDIKDRRANAPPHFQVPKRHIGPTMRLFEQFLLTHTQPHTKESKGSGNHFALSRKLPLFMEA